MRRNTSSFHPHFNPKTYEAELSPFGKKVLGNLIQQTLNANTGIQAATEHRSQREETLTYRERVHHSNKPTQKGLLTFGENFNSAAFPNINSDVERNITFNCIENNKPNIPTSLELLHVVESKTNSEIINIARDDLIQPSIHPKNNIAETAHNTPINSEKHDLIYSKLEQSVNKCENKNIITWSEMFDTELISETIDLLNTSQQVELKHTENSSNNTLPYIKLPLESVTKNTECIKQPVLKRKNQSTITKAMPKKVKKTGIEVADKPKRKSNFRKQKYTKTVKSWLNNVDPNNAVEEEVLPSVVTLGENERKLEDAIKKPKEIINEIYPNEKSTKKVVQAQLANKGGVMKFGKPESKTETITNMITVDSKEQSFRNLKDKAFDKKTRTKFIAPIKSQVPVQDVTYNVYGTESNPCYPKPQEVEYDEVFAVLVYRNGFCQLNKHHTDDSCWPEGIMLLFNDCFLYIKSVDDNNCESLDTILHGNDIICYDGKSILMYLKTKLNIHINDQLRDVKVGGTLIDPDHPPENFTDLQKIVSLVPQYTIATDCVLQKAAWYTTILKESYAKLKCFLIENSLWNIFVNIEMRLLPIIADMECRGVRVDLDKIKTMESVLVGKMKSVEQECYKAAGKVFQINSTVQVRAILYDELQLDTKCNIKIKETICKGAKSTSETMLRSLVSVHPLPKLILEYRHLHKAHATFLTGIAQYVRDGVVKPIWVQTAAATGRIASNNPNLQAIPKAPFNLDMFSDSEQTDPQVLNFRSVYISREGHSFLAADFKHIECRVFAHASADTGLLDALKTKDDLFLVLAAKWLHKPLSEISSEDRERTKRIVYASLYGAGARKLMDILNVSYEQTLSITASFNRTFPCLKSFGRSVVARCLRHGGRLATLCGRVRLISNINSSDFALKSHAERQAVNFIVQGSAADLCKTAMVVTSERLRDSSPTVEGHLLLQIHDELVWEVPDPQLERAAAIIKETMESCGYDCGMPMTLPVAISSGKNWGDLKQLV